jgi:hypothetical protein
MDKFFKAAIDLFTESTNVKPSTIYMAERSVFAGITGRARTHHAVVIDDEWYHLFKNSDKSLSLDQRPFKPIKPLRNVGTTRVGSAERRDIGKFFDIARSPLFLLVITIAVWILATMTEVQGKPLPQIGIIERNVRKPPKEGPMKLPLPSKPWRVVRNVFSERSYNKYTAGDNNCQIFADEFIGDLTRSRLGAFVPQ